MVHVERVVRALRRERQACTVRTMREERAVHAESLVSH